MAAVAAKTTCSKCDRRLPLGTPLDVCPACVASSVYSVCGLTSKPDDLLVEREVFEPEQLVGQGRFKLVRELGAGGMGVVWLAIDEHLSKKDRPKQVALKFLSPRIRSHPKAVEMMKEEVLKSRDLHHQQIVSIYDWHALPNEPTFISMEYIDGVNLAELLREQPELHLEWGQVAPWMKQLCEALHYAHGTGKTIHRDLKPGNLMLSGGQEGRQELKLADFGLARVYVDREEGGEELAPAGGTLLYMSPQQATGCKPHPSDDIYSFGATLYELLTGTAPFYEGDVYDQLMHAEPAPLRERLAAQRIKADVPEHVCQTVLQCLRKTVAERPATIQDTANRLFPSPGRPFVLPRPPEPPPPPPPPKRLWAFAGSDVKDLPSLARKLTDQADAVSSHLNSQLSEEAQQALAGYQGSTRETGPLRNVLLKDLNRVLEGPLLYDAERFEGVELRPKTQELLESSPEGLELVRLNRLLMEDAYPEELGPESTTTTTSSGSAWPLWLLVLGVVAAAAWYALKHPPAPAVFSATDIRDLPSLAGRLRDKRDEVSAYVQGLLSTPTKKALLNFGAASPEVEPVLTLLVSNLNRIVGGQSLYEQYRYGPLYQLKRFQGVSLSPKTRQLLGQNPTGANLARLHRWLLEDAWPQEIFRTTLPEVIAKTDLKDLGSLARKLKDKADSVSGYLELQLSDATRRALVRYEGPGSTSEPLGTVLVQDLNSLANGPSLHEVSRFREVALSPPTQQLLDEYPQGTNLLRLNRWLLEDAYPRELVGTKPPPMEPTSAVVPPPQSQFGALRVLLNNAWSYLQSNYRLLTPGRGEVATGQLGSAGVVIPDLSAGDFVVELTATTRAKGPALKPLYKTCRVELGLTNTVELNFTPGTLWVWCNLPARLEANDYGSHSPAQPLSLERWPSADAKSDRAYFARQAVQPGPWTVRLQMQGFHTNELKVEVVAGQTNALVGHMTEDICPQAGFPAINMLNMELIYFPGFSYAFWMARTETTLKQFRSYAADNPQALGPMTSWLSAAGWTNEPAYCWSNPPPPFAQSENHPVVGVSWEDAKSFCDWLTGAERRLNRLRPNQYYRLPKEDEWKAAVGDSLYPWGATWPPGSKAGNYAGEEAESLRGYWPLNCPAIQGFNDGYPRTAPVGRFGASPLGLVDLGGNVAEWGEEDYQQATLNAPRRLYDEGEGQKYRVLRGASWYDDNKDILQTTTRQRALPTERTDRYGFRVVLTEE